jgi:hypothetical protein
MSIVERRPGGGERSTMGCDRSRSTSVHGREHPLTYYRSRSLDAGAKRTRDLATGNARATLQAAGRALDPFNLPPSLRALVWPSFDFLGVQ